MLLFIRVPGAFGLPYHIFKYISCYCLSRARRACICLQAYSNTSHVIVYLCRFASDYSCMEFKYISCYCLSPGRTLIVSGSAYSNTSHVIVYPFHPACDPVCNIFKYISCYCLSGYPFSSRGPHCIQIHLMLLFIYIGDFKTSEVQLFKYISCYCLSRTQMTRCMSAYHSNTSHVIVYPSIFIRSIASSADSNTSHVIVYLADKIATEQIFQFKYISCYCLSSGGSGSAGRKSIQIHLMLLFIQSPGKKGSGEKNSNTSHVIVYPLLASKYTRLYFIQIHLMLLFIA